MDLLREIFRWTHVIVGFTGLAAFWFPIVARKGGNLHRKAGNVFIWSGYVVTASAAASCVLITHKIFSLGVAEKNQTNLAMLVFLGYLAWVTFVTLRYSVGVLGTKKDPTLLDTPTYRFFAYSAIAASVLIIAYASFFKTSASILLYALSPIGFGTGLPMLKYMKGRVDSKRAWLFEHMTATIGAGIAFHTAFAVFGAQRIFTLPESGFLAVLPWILPTLVGTPGLILWRRHYRRKLGELPKKTTSPTPAPTVAELNA